MLLEKTEALTCRAERHVPDGLGKTAGQELRDEVFRDQKEPSRTYAPIYRKVIGSRSPACCDHFVRLCLELLSENTLR